MLPPPLERGGGLCMQQSRRFTMTLDALQFSPPCPQEIHSKSELLSTINSRLSDREHRAGGLLPPPASYGADGGISPATLEYIQGMREGMDCAMQQLKAEVIHLSRSSLSALDKIVSSVTRSGGAEMYKKAHAFVRKMVGEMVGEVRLGEEVWRIGDRDIEKIKAHHRAPLVKALQEMVICYDNVTDFIKGGLITHDDIVRNAPSLVKMARFCMVHEKSRMDVSPSRSKNPSPSQVVHIGMHFTALRVASSSSPLDPLQTLQSPLHATLCNPLQTPTALCKHSPP